MATTMYMSAISLIVQYLTNIGIVAQGASLATYVGGTVNTPVATYTDSSGVVPNQNPMTLNGAGRTAAASGAPVAFWVPAGTLVKLVVTDTQGALLVQLDNVPAINDLTNSNNALATLLASAATSNASGVGPVGGADFVANALKSYDTISDVRAANAPAPVSGQTITIAVQGGVAVNDGLGGDFYWNSTSTSADDGRNVLKPTSVTGAGRWLRLFVLGVPQITVKTSDQAVTASTVLVGDTALVQTLQPGTYLVQPRLMLQGVGGTGQGYKVQIGFGGTSSAVTCGAGVQSGNGTAAASAGTLNNATTSAAISSTTGDNFNQDYVIVVTATGNVAVLFAQNSSSSNSTLMKAGSLLIVTRVA